MHIEDENENQCDDKDFITVQQTESGDQMNFSLCYADSIDTLSDDISDGNGNSFVFAETSMEMAVHDDALWNMSWMDATGHALNNMTNLHLEAECLSIYIFEPFFLCFVELKDLKLSIVH